MKIARIMILAIALCTKCSAALFVNLGFDEANTNAVNTDVFGASGLRAQLLPGWQLTNGGKEVIEVRLNGYSGGSYAILFDSQRASYPAEGKFILELERAGSDVPNFALSQTGTIPEKAKVLSVNLSSILPAPFQPDAVFKVTLDDVELTPIRAITLDIRSQKQFYDVTPFAGKEATLAFTGPLYPAPFFGGSIGLIDSIVFLEALETPRIELLEPRLSSSGGFTVNVAGVTNKTVEVQASDNLVNWGPVILLVLTNSPQEIAVPTDFSKAFRFFRLVQK